MVKFLNWLTDKLMSRSKKPWARFITTGIVEEQVRFEMSFNKAFIKHINQYGFYGSTDEETIQSFLFASLMIPKSILDEMDNVVNSEAHPHLSKGDDSDDFKTKYPNAILKQ